jgi:large subunit ribosomal protein L7e
MLSEFLFADSLKEKRLSLEKNILENISLKNKLKKSLSKIKNRDYIRANLYIKEYKKRIQHKINQIRLSRNEGKFFIPFRAKVFFVIRIRGINDIPPQTRKILELIRLKQINNGVFLKINSSTVHMVKKIEPYIAYGYPSLRSITTLLKKRGYGKVGKRGCWQRVFLSDNQLIKNALSVVGVNSIEDIIQEVYTGGSRFKEVNNFLWPFKLKSPKKGYFKTGKRNHVSEGGVFGNWEDSINELIYKMN